MYYTYKNIRRFTTVENLPGDFVSWQNTIRACKIFLENRLDDNNYRARVLCVCFFEISFYYYALYDDWSRRHVCTDTL